jgi:hypothetical protein
MEFPFVLFVLLFQAGQTRLGPITIEAVEALPFVPETAPVEILPAADHAVKKKRRPFFSGRKASKGSLGMGEYCVL